MRWLARLMAPVFGVGLLLTGCASSTSVTTQHEPSASATSAGACRTGQSFAASLASSVGGASSPVAAAQAFADHDKSIFVVPSSGWGVRGSDAVGVWVRSGDSELRAIQGTDGTWQIDSGHRCLPAS
jgi:hypothetical protein